MPAPTEKSISRFDPRSVTGCQLWLDAADTSSYNAGALTTWADKSGNSRTATKVSTVGVSVGAINGLNALNFTNTGYMAGVVSNSLATLTVFCVLRPDLANWPAGGRVWSFGIPGTDDWNDSRNTHLTRYGAANGAVATRPPNGNLPTTTPGIPLTSGVSSLVVIQYDGTNGYAYLNGSQVQTPIANPSNFGFTTYSVGAGTGNQTGNRFYGLVGEIIMYTGSLTSVQRQQVEGYLVWKWGIQSADANFLPYSHPFALIPPFSRAFQPVDIGTCQLWMDAYDNSTLFSDSGGTTLATNGGPVAHWKDKSGSGFNMTTADTNQRPTYYSSNFGGAPKPYIYFTGGKALFNNTTTLFNTAEWDVYTVFRCLDGANQHAAILVEYPTYPYLITAGGGLGGISFTVYATDSGGAQGRLFPSTGQNSTSTELYQVYSTGSQLGRRINGIYPGSGSDQVSTFSYPTRSSSHVIGVYSSGSQWGIGRVEFGEILAFSSALTDSQRQQVEGYLAWKWGLRTSLPQAHPFYKVPSSSVLPFFPPNIGECKLWLDGADTKTLLGSLSSITSWIDKSGNGNTMTSGGTAPSWSSNGVYLNGSSYFTNAMTPSTYTAFFVYKKTSSYGPLFTNRNGNVSGFFPNEGGTYYIAREDSTWATRSSTPITDNTTNLICIQYDGSSNIYVWLNGILVITSTTTGTITRSGIWLGVRFQGGGGGFMTGYINEVIYYIWTLSTFQRQQVEGYLAQKWKI